MWGARIFLDVLDALVNPKEHPNLQPEKHPNPKPLNPPKKTQVDPLLRSHKVTSEPKKVEDLGFRRRVLGFAVWGLG